jgi:predicted permease
MVTPGYFRTLGIPIVRGRDFSTDDRRDTPGVFIVNQAFADTFLRGSDPLATSISIGASNPFFRIVGIAGNVKEESLRGQAQPAVFYTYSQISTSTDMFLFVRADNAEGLAQAAVRAIHEIDPNVPVPEARLLENLYGESIARDRLIAAVSGAFALSALLLAALGIYSLLSFQVGERTREIGVRVALGARSSEVLRTVFHQSFRLIIPGVLLGLAGAFAGAQLLEGLLYGIPARDPLTFAAVIVLIVAAAALASFIPARRATHVDPLTALRQE